MGVREVGAGRAELGDEFLVETVLLGNCRAQRQSSVAVVVRGAPKPHQLGRDRVDGIVAHGGRRELGEDVRMSSNDLENLLKSSGG